MSSTNSISFFNFWKRACLFYLPLIGVLGLLLRGGLQYGLSFTYGHILHTHSHVALLGWVYLGLALLLVKFFGSEKRLKLYRFNFMVSHIAVLGMLLSFPYQGYGAVSISFSTLFILASYHFCWLMFGDLGSRKIQGGRMVSWSLIFLIVSSIGPWALGPIIANGYAGSALYHNAIYFYLHFLYNGFFVFALIAILLAYMQRFGLRVPKEKLHSGTFLFAMSCILTFTLSLTWSYKIDTLYIAGAAGAILQLVVMGVLLRNVKVGRLARKIRGPFRLFIYVVIVAFLLKCALQLLSSFPYFAEWIANSRELVIGYLHLVFIGLLSPFILAFLHHNFWNKILLRSGFWAFVIGFAISEIYLFSNGMSAATGSEPLFGHPGLMLFSSGVMLMGLILLSFSAVWDNQRGEDILASSKGSD